MDLSELAYALALYGGPKAFDHVTAISSVLQVSTPLRDPRVESTTGRHAALVAAASTGPFDDTAATLRAHTIRQRRARSDAAGRHGSCSVSRSHWASGA